MEKILRVRRWGELRYFVALEKENGELVDYVHGYPLDRKDIAETADMTNVPEDQWDEFLGYAD